MIPETSSAQEAYCREIAAPDFYKMLGRSSLGSRFYGISDSNRLDFFTGGHPSEGRDQMGEVVKPEMSYQSRSILYFAEPVFEDDDNLSVLTCEKDIPVR